MATINHETIKKLLQDPKSVVGNLSRAQLDAATEHIKLLAKLRQETRTTIPDNPVDFAAKYGIKTDTGRDWSPAPHLHLISDWLKEAELGQRKFLLVSMPPRHGKSLLISYMTPLWLLARNPRRRVILASYEAEFAESWGRRVRNAIGEYTNLGLELDMSTTAASRWMLTTGGGMQTAGAGGPLTGKGADILIIDDPIKNYEEASSETVRENLWQWFQSTAFTRLEPGGFCIILATRWHEDDLIGRLDRNTQIAKEQEAAGEEPEHIIWDILKIPALAEANDPIGRQPGYPLWPERFDKIALERIKKTLSPYNWSALYQQSPTPEEGGAVKRSWWKFYKQPPAEFDQLIQSWDLAFFDLQKSDYCVGQVWGRKGAAFYLLDQVRDRMDIVEVIAAVREFNARYPKATMKLVEAAANGPALIQSLQHEVTGMVPIKPKGTKDARLQAVIPAIQAGNVFLPENLDGEKARWVWEFINECASFPNGANDDQLDAMVHALTYLLPGNWNQISRDWNEAKHGTPPANPLEAMHATFYLERKKRLKRKDREWQQQERLQIIPAPGIPWKPVIS